MAVLARPGVWLRGGMTAVLLGLDLPHAMASLPRGLDRSLAREFFITAEAAFMTAVLAKPEDHDG